MTPEEEKAKTIDATFSVAINTINAHAALVKTSQRLNYPSLSAILFECQGGTLRIVSTNRKMMIVTEAQLIDGSPEFSFTVRSLPRVSAKTTDLGGPCRAKFHVAEGLLGSGEILARIQPATQFPAWRRVIPMRSNLEPETRWRSLCPKLGAIALKVVGYENYSRPLRAIGSDDGCVFFCGDSEGDANTIAILPF